MNFIVNVYKEKGVTSFSIVKTLKKVFQEKKAGHLGTLDPLATGLLPVFLGKTTKLIPLFNELDKEYRAIFKLGERTDTFDAEGRITKFCEIDHLNDPIIENVIHQYRGTQSQLTPIYSAVKQNGTPAYRLARQGKPVIRKSRIIHIESICVESVQIPFIKIKVKCSKGTYIRTLVDDIGQDLGVGAHLVELERIALGPYFSIENACSLQKLTEAEKRGDFSSFINPVELLPDWKTIRITFEEQRRLVQGQPILIRSTDAHIEQLQEPFVSAKVINNDNDLVAIGSVISQNGSYQFHPKKILI